MLVQMGAPIFYADDAAKHIMRTHAGVQQELRNLWEKAFMMQKVVW